MQMQVETFEQTEETPMGTPEAERTEEAIALIEKLGLQGQEKMIAKKEGGIGVRNPYREMSKEELAVYEALYPEHSRIEQYDKGFIPVRVLQVAAHAKELDHFSRIEVWGERTAPKDPLLVGVVFNNGSEYDRRHYILARWGTALEAFQTLRSQAKEAIMKRLRQKAEQKLAECQQVLSCLDACAEAEITGEGARFYI